MIDFVNNSGQVTIGESTQEHFKSLLLLQKGEHMFSPFIGVGIEEMQNDEADLLSAQLSIQKELEQDGVKVNSLTFTQENDSLIANIDAKYSS